jgi:hypothetical protein
MLFYGGWFRSTDLQIMSLTGFRFPTPYLFAISICVLLNRIKMFGLLYGNKLFLFGRPAIYAFTYYIDNLSLNCFLQYILYLLLYLKKLYYYLFCFFDLWFLRLFVFLYFLDFLVFLFVRRYKAPPKLPSAANRAAAIDFCCSD